MVIQRAHQTGLNALVLVAFLVGGSIAQAVEPDAPKPRPGWKIELVASAPELKHPSVVCVAPDGRLFVAEDPMDISAPATEKKGRILCFHPEGGVTVFAENLHAVFGMQYIEGKLYVLHNPKFSVFNAETGHGQDRVDLIEKTNPNPWALDWNDHVPANFRLGMDGYFYVAVGDKGVYGAVGRDGSRVQLRGGGILRFRPDATGLEVYCQGVRNILDVAMDSEDEIFTFDNTDEHDWMGRLSHMVDGGFYGYPYEFVPRRPYTLWMMHDFGSGAATGAFANTEDGLTLEYRDNLFLADFGKRQIIRATVQRQGASFKLVSHEFLFPDPPESFRPVGITPSSDGASIYICDWVNPGLKENKIVGRLWKLTSTQTAVPTPKPSWFLAASTGKPFLATDHELLSHLAHPSKSVRLASQRRLIERGRASDSIRNELRQRLVDHNRASIERWHALWALDGIDGGKSARREIMLTASEGDPALRRQAIRQLGNRREGGAVATLEKCLKDQDASVRFQAGTALGRIGKKTSVAPLQTLLAEESDPFTRFAAWTALNRIGRAQPAAWREIASGLTHHNERVREGSLFALRETYDPALVRVLVALSRSRNTDGDRARPMVMELLASLRRNFPDWKGEWWAYHPAMAPAPQKNRDWSETPKISSALLKGLDDRSSKVRLAVLEGIRQTDQKEALPDLRSLFPNEKDPKVRRAIVQIFTKFKDRDATPLLSRILNDYTHHDPEEVREVVLAASQIRSAELVTGLTKMLDGKKLPDSLRMESLEALAQLKSEGSVPSVIQQTQFPSPEVRRRAVHSLGEIGGALAVKTLRNLLQDSNLEVQKEAVLALGRSGDKTVVPDLMAAWRNQFTKEEALEALIPLRDVNALEVYLEGLTHPNRMIRDRCRKALEPIREKILPALENQAAALSPETLAELRQVFKDHPGERSRIFSSSLPQAPTSADYELYALEHAGNSEHGRAIFFDQNGASCIKCHRIGPEGGRLGPDLTQVGFQFPRRELIEHVLYPSRKVREGYLQTRVLCRDGESFEGVLQAETPEVLTLLDLENRTQNIPKEKISSRQTSNISMMPEGLQVGLTLEQFADLIGFLESRK